MYCIDLKKLSLGKQESVCSPLPASPSVICLGTFDGVHIGHRQLIEEALLLAKKSGIRCCAWTFSAPPASYFSATPVSQITPLEKKLEILAELGLEYVYVGEFPEYQSMDAESFVKDVLIRDCGCIAAVCGFNHRFGKNALGSAEMILKILPSSKIIPPVEYGGGPVSSSRIRALISDGKVSAAAELLGHPYTIEGVTVHGKALGRHLGFPTANIELNDKAFMPPHAVYISEVEVDGKRFPAITNIGQKPTVSDSGDVVCETFLINFTGDLYGKHIKISLLEYRRPEQKFASVEMLVDTVNADIDFAFDYFKIKR